MRLLDTGRAALLLRDGGVIAYPTEGVWGLGCDPNNRQAVDRLLELKQRDVRKGLILVAGTESQLAPFIDMSRLPGERLAEVRASWPGPNTWIVPASRTAPAWITGEHAGIAVRVSAHPVVVALCAAFGGALVSTSANRAGEPAAADRHALDTRFLKQVGGVVVGETGGRDGPSLIRDAATGATLRP